MVYVTRVDVAGYAYDIEVTRHHGVYTAKVHMSSHFRDIGVVRVLECVEGDALPAVVRDALKRVREDIASDLYEALDAVHEDYTGK